MYRSIGTYKLDADAAGEAEADAGLQQEGHEERGRWSFFESVPAALHGAPRLASFSNEDFDCDPEREQNDEHEDWPDADHEVTALYVRSLELLAERRRLSKAEHLRVQIFCVVKVEVARLVHFGEDDLHVLRQEKLVEYDQVYDL